MSINHGLLTNFLVEAKRSTYASQGDEASVQPLLNGLKQLEYRSGDLFYRDIYFGSAFFIGQETVEFENRPIWSIRRRNYSKCILGYNCSYLRIPSSSIKAGRYKLYVSWSKPL